MKSSYSVEIRHENANVQTVNSSSGLGKLVMMLGGALVVIGLIVANCLTIGF